MMVDLTPEQVKLILSWGSASDLKYRFGPEEQELHGMLRVKYNNATGVLSVTEILDRLDAYTGDNVWRDVIYRLAQFDPAATACLLGGNSDRFVLIDGTAIRYDAKRGNWYQV